MTMNSSTEISPSTQLLLDEIRKLFDKFDARWGPTEQDVMRKASQGVPVPTQSTVVGTDVVADNWGGLFNGDDDSDEQHYEAHPVVADNWGGLFEQPAHILEGRIHDIDELAATKAPFPPSPPAVLLKPKVEQCHWFVEALYTDPISSSKEDPWPMFPPQQKQESVVQMQPPQQQQHAHVAQYQCQVEELEEKLQDADNISLVLAVPPQLSSAPITPASAPSAATSVVASAAIDAADGTDIFLEPLQPQADEARSSESEAAAPPPVVDESFHDASPSSTGACADLDLQQIDKVFASLGYYEMASSAMLFGDSSSVATALTMVVAAKTDVVASPSRCSTHCSSGFSTLVIPSTRCSTATEYSKVYMSFEHRYITRLTPAQSFSGVLLSRIQDNHEASKVSGNKADQMFVILWPPSQIITEQGINRVLLGIEPGGIWSKPPWPPPQSKGIWFQLYVSYVLSCAVHECRVTFLHCLKYQVCWKHWLELLQGAVQDELNCKEAVQWFQSYHDSKLLVYADFKLTCIWLRLHMFQLFPRQLQGIIACLVHLIIDRRIGCYLVLCCLSPIESVLPNPSCGSWSGLTYMSMWLPVCFQYISNWHWLSTAHEDELLMINLAWEDDCAFNSKLVYSTQFYFGFWSLFCLSWVAVQYRPPWPPPHQLEMLSDGVQLRPTPWPSFSRLSTVRSTCSAHKFLMQLLYGVIDRRYWKHRDEVMWMSVTWEWHINFDLSDLITWYDSVQTPISSAFVSLLACQKRCDPYQLLVVLIADKLSNLSTLLHPFTAHVHTPATGSEALLTRLPPTNAIMQLKHGGSATSQLGLFLILIFVETHIVMVLLRQLVLRLLGVSIDSTMLQAMSCYQVNLQLQPEDTWLVCTFTRESRQRKCAGAFIDNICIVRVLCSGQSSEQAFQQFPWDPGGSVLIHRLGGKPKSIDLGASRILRRGEC